MRITRVLPVAGPGGDAGPRGLDDEGTRDWLEGLYRPDSAEHVRLNFVASVDGSVIGADGLRTPSLGRVTFPLVRAHVAEMRTVPEAGIVEAMRFLWTRMKLLVEPSGAVPLAALLADPDAFREMRVGVIISGGNVDLENSCRLFAV